MKDLLKKRGSAIAILIIIALLAVPLLGGLKLKAAYNKTIEGFNKAAIATDKHGNSLLTDMQLGVQAAQNLLNAAQDLLGSDNAAVRSADTALNEYAAAKSPMEQYPAYLNVNARMELVYQTAIDTVHSSGRDHEARLDTQYQELLSRAEIIKRAYAGEYLRTCEKADSLISGFPAVQLAKLYGIGGK